MQRRAETETPGAQSSRRGPPKVKVLVRTNDMVRMSFLRALLTDAGIEHVVLDTHMSITEGNANFIAPRLMVDSDDYPRARRLLQEAGLDAG